jgi:hypothetical protein
MEVINLRSLKLNIICGKPLNQATVNGGSFVVTVISAFIKLGNTLGLASERILVA